MYKKLIHSVNSVHFNTHTAYPISPALLIYEYTKKEKSLRNSEEYGVTL